uniref:DUF3715 domain-containing protein n=1 Tax=Esox lucius TaxID=8010 RepID=A0A3P8YVX9_ESOLU
MSPSPTALFQYVSLESREFEDILTILSSSYREAVSNGAFIYTKPRLIHSEPLEKDFVEKRKELKLDGRTEKELEETHCFLMTDHMKLPWICEKGLSVGHSWITALGNPGKGVYLSKYSDLLQINPFNPGVMGEIIIFKVIKGKVKSIYDNMSKNLLDPTPKFDSHFSKNACKVTSIASYRAYELTQQYFYEYDFDELRIRPRHVCPYAVVSFQFKGKDAPLKVTPLLRFFSYVPTGRTKYTVWSGELVNEGKTVSRISFCSYSPPFMPFRLPEKLELGLVMRMDQVTEMIPSALFSWNLYAGSHEVLKNGMYCNLLEVVDNSKSGDSLTALLQNLETQRLVLVHMLTDKGFLFLLSSGQMVTLTERRDGWKNCLQALFVFQESRDVAKYSTRCPASQDPLQSLSSQDGIMPQLNRFVPALHYALVKVRCNPPTDLSAGVEHQAKDYLSGLHDGKIRHIPMTEYDAKLDDRGKLFPAPKHHKLNIEGYLRSYVYSPNLYTMPVARAHEMVETYCVIPEEDSPAASWESVEVVLDKPVVASQVKPVGTTTTAHPLTVHVNLPPSQSPADTKQQKVKKLINIILKCHRNAEADVQKTGEAQGLGGLDPRGLKRKLEREVTTRTLKYLKKASWERGGWDSTAEEQLEEGELEEEEEKEQVEKEVEDVEQRMKATETVSPFSLDPIPPEQTQVRNPLFHTVPLIQNVPPKQNIPPIHCPTASRMDCILDQQFSNFSTELQILLLRESVHYSSPHPPFQNPPRQSPLQPFSEYVSFYNSSPPMHAYVSSLRDRMGTVIDTQEQWIPSMVAHNPPPGSAETRHHHDPTTQYNWNRPLGSEFQSYPNCHSPNPFGPGPDGSNSYGNVAGHVSRGKYPPHMGTVFESGAIAEALPPFTPIIDRLSGPMVESVPGSGQTPPEDISSLISQLKPELFTNLVEIIKDVRKNAVQFYIHTQDSDREFSHYIKRMGNMECSPLSFLEKDNRNDKLMVLIQNKDIAAHVHKVPALVQLKRQPTVVFAGVDSLDDVKNHTYNELFVSGGFVVSDEFVLNPDYITHERLRVILTFLDQQNSAESLWRWRVHCKTQKKLKEQSRYDCEAMKILNLLTTYQKKNVVEFLPYHECDAPSRTAPDLDCLIKLQAQHIQQRHIIFLTARSPSKFSNNIKMFICFAVPDSGIVIANIKDIMHNFGSLVGFHDIRDKLSTSEDLIAAATTGNQYRSFLWERELFGDKMI